MPIKKIASLNNAQSGSLAEFIARRHFEAKGNTVEPIHDGNVDLRIGSVDYDIKSSRSPLKAGKSIAGKPTKYYGNRYEGIRYPMVGFYSDGVVFAEEGQVLQSFPLNKLAGLVADWEKVKSKRSQQHNNLKLSAKAYGEALKNQARGLFSAHQQEIHAIARNGIDNQKKFGKYGPQNLLPKNPQMVDAIVAIWTDRGAVHKIIAFKASQITTLPLYDHKIGGRKCRTMPLDDFDASYIYTSIQDLERRFLG